MDEAFVRRAYRARVRDYTDGISFPATRDELLAYARRKNTPSDIYTELNRLPATQYASLAEVVEAMTALRFGATSR
ncbi:MAG TPA: DUF2795 domain-containing protein [Chloroflexota bacterium]|nr:DUF2795 domain-containing protein [Chloroflexota bacterium]